MYQIKFISQALSCTKTINSFLNSRFFATSFNLNYCNITFNLSGSIKNLNSWKSSIHLMQPIQVLLK